MNTPIFIYWLWLLLNFKVLYIMVFHCDNLETLLGIPTQLRWGACCFPVCMSSHLCYLGSKSFFLLACYWILRFHPGILLASLFAFPSWTLLSVHLENKDQWGAHESWPWSWLYLTIMALWVDLCLIHSRDQSWFLTVELKSLFSYHWHKHIS